MRPGWYFLFSAFPLLWSGPAAARARVADESNGTGLAIVPCVAGDLDQDQICDDVERTTGTHVGRKDTDGDGVADGDEDKDRDGVVDPGETDPRSPGLFPGTGPHIPEPLVFDLVRGLGARRGEVEVNTLAVLHFPVGGSPELHWAPELEWAILDGLAIELELPMVDRELEAIKGAVQYTLPGTSDFAQGLQWLGQAYLWEGGGAGTSLLYLSGRRFGAGSAFSMLGARLTSPGWGPSSVELLFNPSLSYDAAEDLTFSLETNLATDFVHAAVQVIPQVHYQVSRRFRIQFGAGAAFHGDQLAPLAATRLILE